MARRFPFALALLCAPGQCEPMVEEIVSVKPLAIVVKNFASAEEIASLLERVESCHDKLWPACQEQKSGLFNKNKNQSDGKTGRPLRNSTSYTLTLEGELDPVVDAVVRRAHVYARHPITHGEGVQVASYHEGDYYGFHHDSLQRRATFLMYLTTLEPGDGGETIFPLIRAPGVPSDREPPLPPAIGGVLREHLDFKVMKKEEMQPYCDSDYYFKVRPEAGKALLFYSYGPERALDEYAFHGACEVRRGHKATLQRWMRFDPNTLYSKADEHVQDIRTRLGHDILLHPLAMNDTTTTTTTTTRFQYTRRPSRSSEETTVMQKAAAAETPGAAGDPLEL